GALPDERLHDVAADEAARTGDQDSTSGQARDRAWHGHIIGFGLVGEVLRAKHRARFDITSCALADDAVDPIRSDASARALRRQQVWRDRRARADRSCRE